MDSTSDGEDTGRVSDNMVIMPVRNELLCFMQQKCQIMKFEDLAKICTDFYRKEEIITARTLVSQYVVKRIPMRHGSDMLRLPMEDLLKACLEPGSLPTFYAVDLGRLPPVDVEHCDVSAILRELNALRREVRECVSVRQELDALKAASTVAANLEHEFEQLKHQQKDMVHKSELVSLKMEILAEIRDSSLSTPQAEDINAPGNPGADARLPAAQSSTFAGLAKQLDGQSFKERPRRTTKAVIGQSAKYLSNIVSVDTRRVVDLFVTRFGPHTAGGEVIECVSDILRGHPLDQILCERLKSRNEFYASFHVSVSVSSSSFKQAIEVLMSADSWPTGLLVRRYFKPKPKNCD